MSRVEVDDYSFYAPFDELKNFRTFFKKRTSMILTDWKEIDPVLDGGEIHLTFNNFILYLDEYSNLIIIGFDVQLFIILFLGVL